MAVSKKTAAATAEKVENKEVQEATKPVEAKAPATKEATPKAAAKKVVRNAHDMIPCRSVTVGELTCESKKSKGIYYRSRVPRSGRFALQPVEVPIQPTVYHHG